jgi:hypothetical protein
MMEALERGERPEPYHAIGFVDLRQCNVERQCGAYYTM